MTKKCYLDANVLVYLLNKKDKSHKRAAILLHSLILNNFDLYISSLVIDEVLYALRPYMIKTYGQRLIWQKLEFILKHILQLPNLKLANPSIVLQEQMQVVNLMKKYNISPRDAYHLFIVLCNNIDSLATFDQDFSKVKEVEVVGLNALNV